MSKRWLAVYLATLAFGGAMHFFYDWLPYPLVGLFAPVNESVWEHLKLLFWPFLLACLFLRGGAGAQRFWSAALSAQLVMPLFMLAVYYPLCAGFGVETLAADLVLYAVTLALGFCLTARLTRTGGAEPALGLLIVLCGLYAACLVLFSVAAPALPIFESAV